MNSTLLASVSLAKAADVAGEIELRNTIASAIFKTRSNRKVTVAGVVVETWWDSQSKVYVTQVKDPAGPEFSPSDSSGNSGDAAVAHVWALFRFLN